MQKTQQRCDRHAREDDDDVQSRLSFLWMKTMKESHPVTKWVALLHGWKKSRTPIPLPIELHLHVDEDDVNSPPITSWVSTSSWMKTSIVHQVHVVLEVHHKPNCDECPKRHPAQLDGHLINIFKTNRF
jgi:hypothetical protein